MKSWQLLDSSPTDDFEAQLHLLTDEEISDSCLEFMGTYSIMEEVYMMIDDNTKRYFRYLYMDLEECNHENYNDYEDHDYELGVHNAVEVYPHEVMIIKYLDEPQQ